MAGSILKEISKMKLLQITLFFVLSINVFSSESTIEPRIDTIPSRTGNLMLHFYGHASLMIEFKGKYIYIDPVSRYADYNKHPKADLILITHEHGDHLDAKTIDLLLKENTKIFVSRSCKGIYEGGILLNNFDSVQLSGLTVKAVPAYNIVHHRPNGLPFHSKGSGNGYVLSISGIQIYIAGDTENIPEMEKLGHIDIAFLPVNLPYTMDIEMFVDAVSKVNPDILYPYHYGKTNMDSALKALSSLPKIDVRMRNMQ